MAGDGGAREFFQDAELDFVGVEGDEAVEAGGEALGRFAGKSGDEVGVEKGVGAGTEKVNVVGGAVEILRTADGVEDGGIEGLKPDFELEGAGGEEGKDFAQLGGEAVGEHFEVKEEAGMGGEALEEEGENFDGAGDVEVEGAIAEFELAGAAGEKLVEGGEQGGHGEEADGGVVGGDAVVASHGAAAGGFDVEEAVGEIGVGVFGVGEVDR